MKTVKEYLNEYPDSTLREYHNYLKEEEEKKEQEKEDSIRRREELLKSYTGKCFRLDFNSECTIFFKLDKDIDLKNRKCILIDAYSVFIYDYDKMKFNLGFERNRVLNINWLPGQEEWNNRDYYTYSGIIPEESFNKIVKYYDEVSKIANVVKTLK